MALLMQEARDGSIIYDWDLMGEMLRGDNPVTPGQVAALAMVYLSLDCPRDVERFIGLGTVFVKDERGPSFNHFAHTDTMRLVTGAVTEAGLLIAYATIWAHPPIDDPIAARATRNMLVLQVAAEAASHICTIPSRSVLPDGSLFEDKPIELLGYEHPVRITVCPETGEWSLAVAAAHIHPRAIIDPFIMSEPTPLGMGWGVNMFSPFQPADFAGVVYASYMSPDSFSSSLSEKIGGAVFDMLTSKIEGLAAVATSGLSIGASLAVDAKKAESARDATNTFLSHTGMFRGIYLLGGRISATAIGDILVIHDFDLETPLARMRITGFINDCNFNGHNVSEEHLMLIMLNGDQNPNRDGNGREVPGRTPIDPKLVGGLTAEQQQEIYVSFDRYIHPDRGGVGDYMESLEDTRTYFQLAIEDRFGDQYDMRHVFERTPEYWPREVLDFVIDLEARTSSW